MPINDLLAAAEQAGYDRPAAANAALYVLRAAQQLVLEAPRGEPLPALLRRQRRRLISLSLESQGVPRWLHAIAWLLPGPWGIAARLTLFLVDLLLERAEEEFA